MRKRRRRRGKRKIVADKRTGSKEVLADLKMTALEPSALADNLAFDILISKNSFFIVTQKVGV